MLLELRTVGINPLDNTFRSGHFYAANADNLPRIGGLVETKSLGGWRPGVRIGGGFGRTVDGTWREIDGRARFGIDARSGQYR